MASRSVARRKSAPGWGQLARRAFDVARAWWGERRDAQEGEGAAQANYFAGARMSRLTADWALAPVLSADQALRWDLITLRARSRDLVANTSYGERFCNLVADNVIGPDGIRLQARVKNGADEFKDPTNAKLEAAWEEWGEPENCTVDGRLSWVDLQELAARTVAQDGEVLIRMIPFKGNRFGFALQVIDPDLLDENFNEEAKEGKNEIRMGVEVDEWGRAVAYHLYKKHPSERIAARDRTRVDASEIIHLYRSKRAGQTRGIPWFAPVMMDVKMRAGLQEAELVTSRMAACKGVMFEQDPETVPDPSQYPTAANASIPLEATPGSYDLLPPGVKAVTIDPTHPNSAFDAFSTAILHSIAAGLGTSHASLTGDLRSVNYSSIRTGMLQERDIWKKLQRWVVTQLHRRVYREWVKWAITTGALQVGTYDAKKLHAVNWQSRGWSWVDPLKDIQAAKEAVALRIDSRTRLAAEQGRDIEEVFADLDREQQLADEYGVELEPEIAPTAGPPKGAPAADEDAEKTSPAAQRVALVG